MKKLIAALLALALLAGMAPAALASTGDTTIFHFDTNEWGSYSPVENCMLVGDKVMYITNGKLFVYDVATKQTEEYDASVLTEMVDGASYGEIREDDDDDSDEPYFEQYTEIAGWFVNEGEVYALVNVNTYTDNERDIDGGYVRRLALADGAAQLVESDLPKLDWACMIEDYGDYKYTRWAQNCFAAGGSLFVQTYDDDGNNLIEAFDLTTGRNTEHYVQDLYAMVPAGDGRILIMQYNWSEESVHFGFYNPADETLDIRADYAVNQEYYNVPGNLCYSAASDTLYYVLSGEIWAAQGSISRTPFP